MEEHLVPQNGLATEPDNSVQADRDEQKIPQYFTAAELRLLGGDEPAFEGNVDATFPHSEEPDHNGFDYAGNGNTAHSSADSTSNEDSNEDEGAESGSSDPSVDKDPLAGLEDTNSDDGRGQLCELHTYEVRYTSKGEAITLQVGSKEELELEKEKSQEAALVLTREYARLTKELLLTKLEVKSPYIKSALRDVMKSYWGVNLDSYGPITIYDKPHCLFHYRSELKSYAEASDDPRVKQHVGFCLQYMERALRKEIGSYEKLMGDGATPGLEYSNLWMAFRPDDLLYQRLNGHDIICRLRYIDEDSEFLNNHHIQEFWSIRTERVEFDGEDFVYSRHNVKIIKYDGYRPLSQLEIFPLQYLPDKGRIAQDLLARGRKYVSLSGIHYKHYEGAAEMLQPKGTEVMPVSSRLLSRCDNYLLFFIRLTTES
jgi:hypothetical protein